ANCLKNSRSGQNSLVRKIDRTRSFETKVSLPSSSAVPRTGNEKNYRRINEKNSKGYFPAELSLESLEWSNLFRNHSSFASSSATEETEDSGGTLRTDLEETSPSKTAVERQIKATIERTHPSILKQQFMPHSESRKVISTTSGHPECDERADGTSCSVAGSTSTNDDFLQTTPGESNTYLYLVAVLKRSEDGRNETKLL
ncbi:hypothetical protein WUBG_14001, partial [Wuchereria bancrofti]